MPVGANSCAVGDMLLSSNKWAIIEKFRKVLRSLYVLKYVFERLRLSKAEMVDVAPTREAVQPDAHARSTCAPRMICTWHIFFTAFTTA